jgi:microcystin-dependent protein
LKAFFHLVIEVAMSEPFLGQISIFGCNFAPRGWSFCSGQSLPIAQNNALFALLGTQYGGNGTTNFALPDLRGRVPIGQGTGPGLSTVVQGQAAGTETVTLATNQIPGHTHTARANSGAANTGIPTNATWVASQTHYSSAAPDVAMAPTGVGGGGQAHNNMSPSLVLNYCIAVTGIFPSRN